MKAESGLFEAALQPDAGGSADTTPRAAASGFDPFAKGTNSLDITGRYVLPTANGPQRHFGAAVGFNRAVFNGVVVGIDVQGDYNSDPSDEDGYIAGFNLLGRIRLFELGNVSFYVDGTVGAVYGTVSTPREGSNFTFRENIGLGVYFPISNDVLFTGGARLEHMSNGGIDDPNPGYNGVQFYVGVTIPL